MGLFVYRLSANFDALFHQFPSALALSMFYPRTAVVSVS